jgi:hypothetical protein
VVMDWPSRYSGNSISAASVRVQLGNRDYNARRRVVMAQLQVRNDENVGLNWRMAVSHGRGTTAQGTTVLGSRGIVTKLMCRAGGELGVKCR